MDTKAKFKGALCLLGAKLLRKRRPLLIGWAVTGRCNERCPCCGIWERTMPELNTAQCLALIDEMHACGTIALGLTGGEPLLRDDLPELIARAVWAGMVVGLNTNGILLKERLPELKGLSQVTVSLEGPADIHDLIRRVGTFERVIAAIEAARERGLHVEASATINSLNAERIGEVVSICSELKLPVSFQPSVAQQLGAASENELSPAIPVYRRAIDELIRLKRSGASEIITNSLPGLAHLRHWPEATPIACAGGLVSCKIDSVGNVFPCGRCRLAREGMNAPELGLQAAFESIGDVDCAECWCVNRVEFNLLYSLNLTVCANVLRTKAQKRR